MRHCRTRYESGLMMRMSYGKLTHTLMDSILSVLGNDNQFTLYALG